MPPLLSCNVNERNLPVPPELASLSAFIDCNIECIAGPSSELHSVALSAAKHVFDWAIKTESSSKPHLGALLATLAQTAPPQTRSRTRSNSTPERSPSPVQKPPKEINVGETPLSSLLIEAMNMDQIWQQLDFRAARVCQNLGILLGEDENEEENSDGREDEDEDECEEEESDGEEDAAEMDVDEGENLWEELSSGEEDSSSASEGVIDIREETSEDDQDHGSPTSMLDIVRAQRKPKSHSQGHFGLDDGFFNLAAFNAETNELEVKETSKRKIDLAEDEDSAEESEIDLFGLVDASETEAPTEFLYNDFFAPPGRRENNRVRPSKVRFHGQVSVKRIKAVGKGMPVSSMDNEDSDEEAEEDDDDQSSD